MIPDSPATSTPIVPTASDVSSSQPAICARGLGRRFGRTWALAHVDLKIAAGELVLLAGANGSGKTTLLRLFAGLAKRSRGELSVFGHDPYGERLLGRRDLTFVSHQGYLYDQLTAREMLALWSRLGGLPSDDETLHRLLARVGLEEHTKEQIRTFSAGMRKRLTLLRVDLEKPRLVLLDEPFAALDLEGQALIERWIATGREAGTTFVVASHALQRATRLGGQAILLQSGQIAWRGPADQLITRYQIGS